MTLIDSKASIEEISKLEKKNKDFAKVVKIALLLNFLMFFLEFLFGIYANSMALITDSFDFLGDSLNYIIAIYVLKKSSKFQSYSAIIKSLSMLFFGLFVSFLAIQKALSQEIYIPSSFLMVLIASIALLVNISVSFLLFKFRNGNSNQKSVWLCSRNDAINNIMVIVAGLFVYRYSSIWPDIIAASIMAILAISSSISIFKSAKKEIKIYKKNSL